jgi:hypothetical protein
MRQTTINTALLGAWLTTLAACTDHGAVKGGRLRVTISAESLGAHGYVFPPTAAQELTFVDGWDVRFQRILAVVDRIRLSEVPDRSPSDQSQMGATLAERRGPFIVDLLGGGTDLDKGGAGKVAVALPIADLDGIFDLEQRYAFSYELVAARNDAEFVNVAQDDVDVAGMVAARQRLLFVGTARFRGVDCSASDSEYDFSTLPTPVQFRFGLTGAVSYSNCQNPDNSGEPAEGEEYQRGIALLPNATTTAQITIHTDHLFWPTISHENLPLFNQFALNAVVEDGVYRVDLDALSATPVPTVTDRNGAPFPWRSCVAASLYQLPSTPSDVTFDVASQNISNLRDFVALNTATMGHLNANGLCYVAQPSR